MKNNHEKLHILILIFGLLLGAYARLLPTIMIGFPVTDGGLFYVMVQAIQNHGYALPAFVEYNGISIPFAYPPLGFYLTALISQILRIPLIEVFRWLPAILSIAFTIAFYPLAASILKSPFKGSLAAIFFALLPRSIGWYIMGGGITRALGQLFLMLTLYAAYKLFTAPDKKHLWLTIIFGSGAVLSHPESALHTAALCFVLLLFFGRSKQGIKNALLAAFGIAIIISPFFISVITRHGIQPYQSAANTGLYNFTAWLGMLTGSFADEKFITVISALAMLGLFVSITKRDFLLVVWLLLPAVIDPRGAASISIIAWSLFAAIGFADAVIPGLYTLQNKKMPEILLNSAIVKSALTALIFYSFFGVVVSDQVYPKVSLTAPERAAMIWIDENIPTQSRFIVLTGSSLAFSDAFSEWFPALTKSVSLATVQGYEWMEGKSFTTKLNEYDVLQICMKQDYTCIEQWAVKTKNVFEYVLISHNSPLAASLPAAYQLVYNESNIYIFKYAP